MNIVRVPISGKQAKAAGFLVPVLSIAGSQILFAIELQRQAADALAAGGMPAVASARIDQIQAPEIQVFALAMLTLFALETAFYLRFKSRHPENAVGLRYGLIAVVVWSVIIAVVIACAPFYCAEVR
ncbi:MAG TPA: hypothetical protein VGK19_02065 [Capsulimonadaceae bacterium]